MARKRIFCHVFAKNLVKGSYCSQKDREHHPINGVHCLFEDENFSLPALTEPAPADLPKIKEKV